MRKKILYLFKDKFVFFFLLTLFIDFIFKPLFEASYGMGYIIQLFLVIVVYFRNRNNNKKNNITGKQRLWLYSGFFCFTLMSIVHLLTTNVVIYKLLYVYINYLFLLYFTFFSQINKLEYIGIAFKLFTIIGCISVLYSSGFDTESYWRNDALIDKGFLTIFVAISQSLCIIDLLFKKDVKVNIAFFLFIFFVNMFFVQSKTAMFTLAMFLMLFLYLIKGQYFYLSIFIFVVGCIIAYIKADSLISGSMASAVNRFTGIDLFQVDSHIYNVNMATFDVRDRITDYCLQLFASNPVWGIGIGVYREMGGYRGIPECESTYLDLLVEGGLLYFLPVFAYLSIPLIKGIYYLKKNGKILYHFFWSVSVLLSMAVCFIWNDFLLPSIFALIGISINTLYRNVINKVLNY